MTAKGLKYAELTRKNPKWWGESTNKIKTKIVREKKTAREADPGKKT